MTSAMEPMSQTLYLDIPGSPMGKQRPRVNTHTRVAYTPKETMVAERDIKFQWSLSRVTFPQGMPLAMTVICWFARPQSHFNSKGGLSATGKRTPRPIRKPDHDNIIKLISDALEGCAYPADAAIVEALIVKHWAPDNVPHTEVTINDATAPPGDEAAEIEPGHHAPDRAVQDLAHQDR